jgi:hypothetical protein
MNTTGFGDAGSMARTVVGALSHRDIHLHSLAVEE